MKFNLAHILMVLVLTSISIFAQGRNIISGKLVKPDGKPLAYTELELVPVDSNKIVIDSNLVAISYANGNFTFGNVPAGKYTLSINFDDKPTDLSPYGTFFYPDATERSKAQIFAMTGGVKFTGLLFRLPAPLAQIKIKGNAIFTNGKACTGAFIAIRDVDFDYAVPYGVAQTDRNGDFSVTAFATRTYQFGAILFEKDTKTVWEARDLEIVAAGESKIFTLAADTPVIKIELKTSEDFYRIKERYLGMLLPARRFSL